MKDFILQFWEEEKFELAIQKGYQVLFNPNWYLPIGDVLFESVPEGVRKLSENNLNSNKILGGEVIVNVEIEDTNIMQEVWPVATRCSEILWSQSDMIRFKKPKHRFLEQRCRLKKRGIKISPIWPTDKKTYCF